MEVGQGPNWGCNAKGEKQLIEALCYKPEGLGFDFR
jgi:hypothetical protein